MGIFYSFRVLLLGDECDSKVNMYSAEFRQLFYCLIELLSHKPCYNIVHYCDFHQSSRFGLACLQVYGYGLIALFVAFSKRKYKKKD